jgi:hypothetical protein
VEKKDRGIVLKTFFPRKQKVSILFKDSGKRNVAVSSLAECQRLYPGMLVSSFVNCTGDWDRGSNFTILDMPICDANDLTWLHTLLELCYYFVPVGDQSRDIFEFLVTSLELLTKKKSFDSFFVIVKKLCVLKLLCLFSFYPPKNIISYVHIFHSIVSVSVDYENYVKVNSLKELLVKCADDDIKNIDNWIAHCVRSHPCSAFFKTHAFLYKNCKTN